MKIASFLLFRDAALAAIFLCAGNLTHAATLTTQQTVKAQVDPTCTIEASFGQPMAFGSPATTPALLTTQTGLRRSVTVICTAGTSYSIVAGEGNNYSSGWRMVNGSGQYVTYMLTTDSGRTTPFPRSGNTVGGTGTGMEQYIDVWGRVPAQTAGGTGTFTDAVTFTVTY